MSHTVPWKKNWILERVLDLLFETDFNFWIFLDKKNEKMAMAMNPIQVLRGGAEEEKEMILIKNIKIILFILIK